MALGMIRDIRKGDWLRFSERNKNNDEFFYEGWVTARWVNFQGVGHFVVTRHPEKPFIQQRSGTWGDHELLNLDVTEIVYGS